MYTKHYAANNGGKSCFKVDAKSSNKGSFVLHAHVPMETSMFSDLFLASMVRANVSLSVSTTCHFLFISYSEFSDTIIMSWGYRPSLCTSVTLCLCLGTVKLYFDSTNMVKLINKINLAQNYNLYSWAWLLSFQKFLNFFHFIRIIALLPLNTN